MIDLKFDSDDAEQASESWGCNCGPAALAAVLGQTLDDIRPAVMAAGFADKGYMNPTMMKAALSAAGGGIKAERCFGTATRSAGWGQFPDGGLARIQFTGWWTEANNWRVAYGRTHWVASYRPGIVDRSLYIFDINGGLMRAEDWEKKIVPAIAATLERADGGWFVTHRWETYRSKA